MKPSLPLFRGLFLCLVASWFSPFAGAETPAEKDARMQWWREARFGLFIHWGIYSVPAGTWQGQQIPGIGEWIMNKGKIPVADYAKFAGQFNPVKFDAETWVKTAKAAGQKYIIITSKHHDGFAMFKSLASPYNIVDATPFKHDPLKDLAAACQREGIKLGFYYSQAQDWHQPGGAASGGHWDPAQDGNMDEYLQKIAVPQVKEILTNYGKIAVLWWDTPQDMTKERADLLAPLLSLQPGIITNNRLGGGYLGDTETPENKVPATGYPRDWEACMTMNDTWGFKSYDQNWKSSETLIRTLIDIVSKGGNYLLNVGPTSEGEIPAPSVERLRAVGAWLKVNGAGIYGTKASPFKGLTWGRATQKPDTLYLHVFDWPADGKLVVPMRSGAKHAYLLSDPKKKDLHFAATPTGLVVQVPAQAVDSVATTIVLTGVGRVEALPPPPIQAAANGSFILLADAADLSGPNLRVEGNTQLNLGAWRSTEDFPRWNIQVNAPGKFEVAVMSQVAKADAGSDYVIAAGDQTVAATTKETKGYTEEILGTLTLTQAGPTTITLKPGKLAGSQLMQMRQVVLNPAAN